MFNTLISTDIKTMVD